MQSPLALAQMGIELDIFASAAEVEPFLCSVCQVRRGCGG